MAQNSGRGETNHKDGENSLSSIVQNMALAHELVMDENFKINEEPADSLKGQVKQIIHKAFWDSLAEELAKDPPNYAPAIKLLGELKETLLSVLFDHNVSIREQINNILDLELITQQSDQGTVDIQGYAAYIIEVISKICTPERDDAIEKLKKVEGLVPLFREIFHVLDLMKLDMANFQLSQIRPQLVQQSVEFEQSQFREYLNANPDGLLSTTKWIKSGMDAVNRRHNEQTDNCEKTLSEKHLGFTSVDGTVKEAVPNLSEVVKYCYIGILLGEGGFPYPETLLMDQHRMSEMRQSMQCLVRVASVLVVTLNMVDRHLTSDSEYKKTLKETVYVLLKGTPESQLQNVFPNIGEQVVKETTSFISKRGLRDLDEENANNLKLQVINLAEDDHTISKLIKKRVEGFLQSKILAKESSHVLFPAALLEVESELNELTTQFTHIVSHNFAVFRPFYEQVIQSLT